MEINKTDLTALSRRIWQRKPHITGYEMADGRVLNLLAEGRLVNLAAGNGHPAEIMDMSFGIQALCLEYLAKNGASMTSGLYTVPAEIDRQVALVKLGSLGLSLDRLTPSQQHYLETVN